MALAFGSPFDIVVLVIVVVEAMIPILVIYGIYKLIQFVRRANRFMDEWEQDKRKREPPS